MIEAKTMYLDIICGTCMIIEHKRLERRNKTRLLWGFHIILCILFLIDYGKVKICTVNDTAMTTSEHSW